jgi:hypothetical protein
MDDGRDRGGGTGAYVGGRACNGRGGGNAAEERRNDVARTLADKFGIELCFLPVIPSSTTAHSRDSMAPSIAMEKGSRQQGGERLPA